MCGKHAKELGFINNLWRWQRNADSLEAINRRETGTPSSFFVFRDCIVCYFSLKLSLCYGVSFVRQEWSLFSWKKKKRKESYHVERIHQEMCAVLIMAHLRGILYWLYGERSHYISPRGCRVWALRIILHQIAPLQTHHLWERVSLRVLTEIMGLMCQSGWRAGNGSFHFSCPDCEVLCGARRLRPPVRVKAPSWDLAVVLEGIVDTPLESLRL